jgi:hypothetical protein
MLVPVGSHETEGMKYEELKYDIIEWTASGCAAGKGNGWAKSGKRDEIEIGVDKIDHGVYTSTLPQTALVVEFYAAPASPISLQRC